MREFSGLTTGQERDKKEMVMDSKRKMECVQQVLESIEGKDKERQVIDVLEIAVKLLVPHNHVRQLTKNKLPMTRSKS